MALAVKFEVEKRSLRDLNAALAKYADFRKLDNRDALHRAGRQLAYSAMYNTKKASAAELSAKLNKQIGTVAFTKTGRVSKKREAVYAATTVAKRDLAVSLRRGTMYYKKFPRKADPRKYSAGVFNQMALAYAKRRISSAAFIASGWKPAWLKFRSLYKRAAGDKASAWRKGKGKGGAIAATFGHKPSITLWNASTTESPTSFAALQRYGGQGLQAAVRWVTADMLGYIRKQLAKRAQTVSR